MDSPNAPAKAPLEPALRALAERERAQLGPHLDPDELVAYHERKLDEAEGERARDHLALCPECAGLLLDLAAFDEPESPAGAPDLTSADIEAGWRELAPRLAREGAPIVPFVPRRPVSPMIPWAIAAALAIAVIGLSARVATLRSSLRIESQPRADVAVKEVPPEDEGTRGGDDSPPPSAARPLVLSLHAPSVVLDHKTLPPYDLEILSPRKGAPADWSPSDVQLDSKGQSFHVYFSPGTVPPGELRVRLYGLIGGVRTRLADYALTIGP